MLGDDIAIRYTSGAQSPPFGRSVRRNHFDPAFDTATC